MLLLCGVRTSNAYGPYIAKSPLVSLPSWRYGIPGGRATPIMYETVYSRFRETAFVNRERSECSSPPPGDARVWDSIDAPLRWRGGFLPGGGQFYSAQTSLNIFA